MSEIGWPAPFGYTDFCDDIRHELAGKTTLVGMYAGEMKVFGNPPLAVSQLCLAIHYFEDPADADKPLRLLVHLPTDLDENSPSHQIDIPPRQVAAAPPASDLRPGDDIRLTSHYQLRLSPFIVVGNGRIRVRMQRGDDIVRMGTLRVAMGTPEEAAQMGVQFAQPQPTSPDTPPAA